MKADVKVVVDVKEDEIAEAASWNLNGRQIKNVVSIAQAVATQRKETITLKSLIVAGEFARMSWKPVRKSLTMDLKKQASF